MAALREYRYVLRGIETTAMLTEADAKRLNATPVTGSAGSVRKQAVPVEPDDEPAETKARDTVPDTARAPRNKRR